MSADLGVPQTPAGTAAGPAAAAALAEPGLPRVPQRLELIQGLLVHLDALAQLDLPSSSLAAEAAAPGVQVPTASRRVATKGAKRWGHARWTAARSARSRIHGASTVSTYCPFRRYLSKSFSTTRFGGRSSF